MLKVIKTKNTISLNSFIIDKSLQHVIKPEAPSQCNPIKKRLSGITGIILFHKTYVTKLP